MNDNRTESLRIRLSPEEKAALKELAGDQSVSEYVRQITLSGASISQPNPFAPVSDLQAQIEGRAKILAAKNGWPLIRARAVARRELS